MTCIPCDRQEAFIIAKKTRLMPKGIYPEYHNIYVYEKYQCRTLYVKMLSVYG